jgi:hypothetical protein
VFGSLRNGFRKAPKPEQVLRRLTGRDQFTQADFALFVAAVQEAGTALLPIDAFAERYVSFYDDVTGEDARFGLAKFDIHGDILRPVAMARLMKARGAPGLFLAMHRHALNEAWYGTPGMWDALAEIRDLGHEIGLHMDPFHLITQYGDLYEGAGAALEDFRSRGYQMRTMTLHGDSRPHIKATKLQANDFFAEGFRQSKWNGAPPAGQEALAEHVRRYKHKKLFRKYGIEYVADVALVREGDLIARDQVMYCSDNQRRIRIGNISPEVERTGVLAAPDQFRIAPEFAAQAARLLARRPFLALFHPQWYA